MDAEKKKKKKQKQPKSVMKDVEKRVRLFLAQQADSATPFVGLPDGAAATLLLSGLGLPSLPETVLSITQLQGLNISFNKMESFPQLSPLVKLEVLHLEGNKLTSISGSLGSLKRLRELHLNGNQLGALPEAISSLSALETLAAANNRLATLPPQISCLSRLEELNLNGNPLAQGLPAELGRCVALEIVDLSACQLTVLPDEFTFLTRMMELNLASNRLVRLPEAIGRMTRLARLDLSFNRLADLPVSMGYLTALQTLMVQENPIQNSRLLEKFAVGCDHLVDFLEKRLMEYLAFHPDMDLQQLDIKSTSHHRPPPPAAGETVQVARPIAQSQIQTMSLEQKLELIRKEGIALVDECRSKISTMKRMIATTQSLDQALGHAQMLRNMKPCVEELKSLLPPLPKPSPPLLQQSDDKLTAVRKTVNVAIFDLENILGAANNALLRAQDARVILRLVKIVKSLVAAASSLP